MLACQQSPAQPAWANFHGLVEVLSQLGKSTGLQPRLRSRAVQSRGFFDQSDKKSVRQKYVLTQSSTKLRSCAKVDLHLLDGDCAIAVRVHGLEHLLELVHL